MDLVRNAELMSVGVDEVVVTFTTGTDVEITTRVGDHDVTTTGPFHVARVTGLEPATVYPLSVETEPVTDFLPDRVRTLDRPAGRLLATVATANDVHFGETECGKLGHEVELGPVLGSRPGEPPYPEVMNRAAVDEIAALDPDAVVVKGDLTNVGSEEEYGRFLEVWSELGERMHHVRGNHDAMISERIAAHAPFAVVLPGVVLAVLDTVTPGTDRGRVTADELAWLDALAAGSTDPVLVFGHHHPWDPDSNTRPEHYFGIHPDDSVALCEVVARREAIAGYFAGHTHRNRIRHFAEARWVPMVEVACVKDYPGAWAEYRVYEGGYTQVMRRIGAAGAMDWTERTREMFAGLYRDYALGSLADRCFSQPF